MKQQPAEPLAGSRFMLRQLQHVGRLKKDAAFAAKRRMQRRFSIDAGKALSALVENGTKNAHLRKEHNHCAKQSNEVAPEVVRHASSALQRRGDHHHEFEAVQEDCRMWEGDDRHALSTASQPRLPPSPFALGPLSVICLDLFSMLQLQRCLRRVG